MRHGSEPAFSPSLLSLSLCTLSERCCFFPLVFHLHCDNRRDMERSLLFSKLQTYTHIPPNRREVSHVLHISKDGGGLTARDRVFLSSLIHHTPETTGSFFSPSPSCFVATAQRSSLRFALSRLRAASPPVPLRASCTDTLCAPPPTRLASEPAGARRAATTPARHTHHARIWHARGVPRLTLSTHHYHHDTPCNEHRHSTDAYPPAAGIARGGREGGRSGVSLPLSLSRDGICGARGKGPLTVVWLWWVR